jgi:hypothetical protein
VKTALILSLAIGSASFMLAKAEIFTWLRTGILEQGRPGNSYWKMWKQLYKLIGCPYCLSVWMCLIASLIWDVRLVPYQWPLGWLATSLAMTVVAMAGVLIIQRALGK